MEDISGQAPLRPEASFLPARSDGQPKEPSRVELAGLERLILAAHPNMRALSRSLVGPLLDEQPRLQQVIAEFKAGHAEQIKLIQEQDWVQLRWQLGDAMERPLQQHSSLQDFRVAANQLINYVVDELGQQLQLPVAHWAATGTEGYQSDVDIALRAPQAEYPLAIEHAVIYKTLRDCTHCLLFGGLSGPQLDTECYAPHPADLNFGRHLHTERAKAYFLAGEKAAVLVQRCVSLHPGSAVYAEAKQADLGQIAHPQERQVMTRLYASVEALNTVLERRIHDQILQQHPPSDGQKPWNIDQMPASKKRELCLAICKQEAHAYKEARELCMVPLRMQMAMLCTRVGEEIVAETQLLEEALTRPGSERAVLGHQKELDVLHLELQRNYAVINFLQDEGTASVAEGMVTLLKKFGQIYAHAQQASARKLSDTIAGSTDHLDPMLRRRASASLVGSLRHGRDIAQHVYLNEAAESLQPHGFDAPSGQTLILAAYEEVSQLERSIESALAAGQSAQKAAVQAGKYAYRVAGNLRRAIEAWKAESQGDLPVGFKRLLRKAQELESKARQLERCKRKFSLSPEAAAQLLVERIRPFDHKFSADPVAVRALEQKLIDFLVEFERGGKEAAKPNPIEVRIEKLTGFLRSGQSLVKFDFLSGGRLPSDIVDVLRAWAGESRLVHPELDAVHREAERQSTESLGMTGPEALRGFLGELKQLGFELRNLSRQHGLFPTSEPHMVSFCDFVGALQRAQEWSSK